MSSLSIKLFVLACLLLIPIASAQDPTPESSGGLTIHIVQRDETLFQIAAQYGTTLDALSTVNSLLDPDKLTVGQRLIIPENVAGRVGVLETHTVAPGETLFTIAQRYASTAESLAEANHLTSATALYAGQIILVTQGITGTPPESPVSLHTVTAQDRLYSLSLRYAVPWQDILQANGLTRENPLQVGTRLIIPRTTAGERFVRLPEPILDFQLGPLPAQQGKTLSAYLKVQGEMTITGKLLDREVRFFLHEGAYYAMIGIHSLTEPGVYPLQLTLTAADGTMTHYEPRLEVMDGGYRSETITLPPDRQTLLDTSITTPEAEQIQSLMSGYTGEKYFSGLMNLPSTGPLTSQYGTRRTYQDSDYATFHGGADFGGAAGSSVMAPASGIVVFAGPLQVRGNAVILDHGWGVYSGFWHNHELFVSEGQFVQRGAIISTLGNTGLSTGAHLHWEMWVGGVQVNPLQWLTYSFDQFNLSDTETAALTP